MSYKDLLVVLDSVRTEDGADMGAVVVAVVERLDEDHAGLQPVDRVSELCGEVRIRSHRFG